MREERRAELRRGIPLRAVVPNAVTALALCVGLTCVRFAIAGDWEKAFYAIVGDGVFDVVDGRIARLYSILNPDKLDHLGPVSDLGLRPSVRRG